MDNPWANAWATSDSTTTSDEPAWEHSTTANKPWTQPSNATEPAWSPPSPQWIANEPTWRPPTPQWSKSESEAESETQKDQEELIGEEEGREWPKPSLSTADEEEVRDIIAPASGSPSQSPPQSPVPVIDTDAFGSFEAAQWGHEGIVSQEEDDEEDSRDADEWELARQEKAKQDQYVPPELLSAILAQLELLSNDIFPRNAPNYDTAPGTLARDIVGAVEGLEAVANQLIPTSISLEPIPPFPKSWIHKKTADAVRLSRHSSIARQASPLAKYLESKGSTAWEAAVKSRPEPIHDDSDVLPAGWKVLDSHKDKGTVAVPDMKRKSTGILSFFGRNKVSSPVTSTPTSARTSPAPSPRPSLDLGKGSASPASTAATSTTNHMLPLVAKPPSAPAPGPTPSTSLATSSAISTEGPNLSPDIFPPEASPPSAVSRFLGRFSRTKSTDANSSSMALSSDDLDFLTEHDTSKVVPSALDDDDGDPLGFGSLQSEPVKQTIPSIAPPPLLPSPPPPPSTNAQNSSGKVSLTVPPVLPLDLPSPSSFGLGTSDDPRTPTGSGFNSVTLNTTSKQNNGKGFGWVPPAGSTSGGFTLTNPASSSSPTRNTTAGNTPTVRHVTPVPPSSKAGKRPTPVAIMSSSPSTRPAPSPKLPPPPPSGQIPLLAAPSLGSHSNQPPRLPDLNFDNGASQETRLKAQGKGPEKDTLPPLPTESYAGPSSSADDDDDFADFQDSSFTSATSNTTGFGSTYSHRFNQSISSTSSASETSFFGGLGDSSMDSNMSTSVSGSSVSGDGNGDEVFSDFDDFVSGLTAQPSTNTVTKSQTISHSPSKTLPLKSTLLSAPSTSLSSPPISPPVQQLTPESQSYHQRTQSLLDSAKRMKSWPSSSSVAASPPPTLSRQNTGNTFPTPIMSSGSSPALSRQNTGNANGQASFPPVIMSTSRQNTNAGTFPTVIMSAANARQNAGANTSSGILPILPGPPGFGPSPTAVKSSSPVATMDIFGSNEGNGSPLSFGLSPPPAAGKGITIDSEDPLDLFGVNMVSGSNKPVSPTTLAPITSSGRGGLSAQDLSFFEGL